MYPQITRWALLGVVAALMVSCASSQVVTDTTAFYVPGYESRGTLAVVASDAGVNSSLEFAYYKSKFEKKLAKNGYTIVEDPNDAEYIALVAYGIDQGKTSVVSTPIFGQTGGGTTYSSGTVSGAGGTVSYSNTTYTMPTYGVVRNVTSTETTYTRGIALDIVEARSLREGKPEKVYEARAKSSGSCGSINDVFDEMLEGMFTDFPGKNGKTRHVNVSFDGDC